MALLFMDGFDHYATADLAKKGWLGGTSSIGQTGRRGGGALKPQGYTYVERRGLKKNATTVIMGMSHHTGGAVSQSTPAILMVFYDGAYEQVTITGDASGYLQVRRGGYNGPILGQTALAVVEQSVPQYFEAKVVVGNTTGAVELRLNGGVILNLTGADTQVTANAYINGIGVNHLGTAFSFNGSIDDLYVCDTTGTTNNDFLGDCRIDTLYPNADGTYTDLAPSTGTSHYALVDETAPNATDFNSSGTVGARDSYGYPDLPTLANQAIYGVQVNAALTKDDAGNRSAAPFARSGTTNADGTGVTLGTSQTYVSQVFETKPGGGAWTEADVNAAEFGVTVTA